MPDSFVSDSRHLPDLQAPSDASAPFSAVDIRAALHDRPTRAPDYEMEDRALGALALEMAERPANILQKLAEKAVELCRADTAGISLLETHQGTELFRWEGLAGIFAAQRNNTMPRNASPCGVCIDENATQLMYLADRCFPALYCEPRFVEALLIPFHYQGKPVGTVWAVMNQFERRFDAEDERQMRTLAAFASAGWQHWRSTAALKKEVEERKRAEEELRQAQNQLSSLSAMLLRAQETERRLLARELHDDFNQKLVALSMQASALSKSSPETPEAAEARLAGLRDGISALADDIHRISHQLHPAILDDLGLEVALRDKCDGFSQRQGIPVRFEAQDVPRSVPPDIALCLFRVTQESFRNIAKHAGAREVRVRLAQHSASLFLAVEDFGGGFDVGYARGKGGLGLISMEERVRLLNGHLRIHSRPGVGTQIEAQVPLPEPAP